MVKTIFSNSPVKSTQVQLPRPLHATSLKREEPSWGGTYLLCPFIQHLVLKEGSMGESEETVL